VIRREILRAAPIRCNARQVADDQPGGEDAVRFDVFGIDARVADMRIRQRDDLPGIRRIGEDLLISGHRRVEHDFADARPVACVERADGAAAKHRPVGKRE
jgi:hypothetical protein